MDETPIPIKIRDALVANLVEHIAPVYGMSVFPSRITPYTKSELPAVSVFIGDASYDTQAGTSSGMVVEQTFALDLHHKIPEGDDIDLKVWEIQRDIHEAIGEGAWINQVYGERVVHDLRMVSASRAELGEETDQTHVRQSIIYQAWYLMGRSNGVQIL